MARSILLTGATGVLGSEVLSQLLQHDCEIWLVVRAQTQSGLQSRTNDLLEFCGKSGISSNRVRSVMGDVSRPGLGIADKVLRHLANEITHVVHCAGNVRLNQEIDSARRCAVGAARNILDFAWNCRRRKKVDVVSTIGVCGNMQGVIPERPLLEQRTFRNNYEAAKAEAEELYCQAIQEGLPLTILRPSMIVGHSQTGRVRQFQVFYHLCEFIAGLRTRGIVVDLQNTTLDLIPVDLAARMILDSSGDSKCAGKILHLCSGPQQSIPLKTLTIRTQRLFQMHGRPVPRLLPLPVPLFGAALSIASVVSKRVRRQRQALRYLLVYLNAAQEFAVQETQATLGYSVPHWETYLDKILEYYCRRGQKGDD